MLNLIRYYINEKDQIRSIAHPEEEFNFFISKNERVLEVQREAMDSQLSLKLAAFLADCLFAIFSLHSQ